MQLEQQMISKTNEIQTGEIYGKQTNTKFVMYNVIKVAKGIVTLQNIDNPLSLFESTGQKLYSSGYIRISQTPYINQELPVNKKKKGIRSRTIKINRCPHTLDFIEARADNQRPTPIIQDLFAT